jgi:hypothetical protein
MDDPPPIVLVLLLVFPNMPFKVVVVDCVGVTTGVPKHAFQGGGGDGGVGGRGGVQQMEGDRDCKAGTARVPKCQSVGRGGEQQERRNVSRKEGRNVSRKEGRNVSRKEGKKEGMSVGKKEGMSVGKKEGKGRKERS